jgi:hypothetical protein
MAARYILGALAVLFLVLGLGRRSRDGGRVGPAARSWLLIALFFGAAAAWSWFAAR